MGSLLHDPVADARDIQMPDPTGGLRNVHPTRWRRAVPPLLQFAPEVGEEARDATFFDGLDGFTIDSGGPTVSSNSLPGALQDVGITHLVIERVESSRWARLGGPIQRPLELSSTGPCASTDGVVSLAGIHRSYLHQDAWIRQGAFPRATLCCRRRHQYRMLPSDCRSAGTPLRRATYRKPRSDGCVTAGRRRLSPVSTSTLSPFRAPYAGGFLGAACPGASRRPWPSPTFTGLGSLLVPLRGLSCRRGRLHFMLRTGELLDPQKGLRHDASPVGSRLAAVTSYRAAWSLPGPDSHRLVDASLCEIPPLPNFTSFLGCPATWAR